MIALTIYVIFLILGWLFLKSYLKKFRITSDDKLEDTNEEVDTLLLVYIAFGIVTALSWLANI